MKNSILSMAIIALMAFGCSNESITESRDQNLTIKNKSGFTENIIKGLEADEAFRNFFISNSNINQRKNGENGVMLLTDGYNLGYGASDGNNLFIISGTGSIEALPNGRAKFSVHTNNASAAVIDLATFSTLFSSDCIDGPTGTFNYNLISEYEVVIFEPIPGLIFTFYSPTYVNASAEVANGHCNMSDAQPIFDNNFEMVGCSDATEYKTIRLNRSGITVE